jgi:hypothetical protein
MLPRGVRAVALVGAVVGCASAPDVQASKAVTLEHRCAQQDWKGKKFVACLDVDSLEKGTPQAFLYWGASEDVPVKRRVVGIEIAAGDSAVEVPLSAFGGLGDPGPMRFELSDGSLSLVLEGGDRYHRYEVRFWWEHGLLSKRRVTDVNCPGGWEETRYSGPHRCD